MNQPVKQFKANIFSFIGVLVFIGLLIVSLFIFSYLLILGAIIGLVIFSIAYIRAKWMQRHWKPKVDQKDSEPASGRIIEHDQ